MSEVVRVASRRVPAISWSCPTCHDRMPFDCSERFRANSNGKLVDIWLIYRCRRCASTKNITIVERRPVHRVPRSLLLAAEANDVALARQCARDIGLLRRNGAAVVEGDDWTLEPTTGRAGPATLVLELDEPMLLRLDAVIAAALGVSRTALRARLATGDVRVEPGAKLDALRLWDGRISVAGSDRALDGPASSVARSPVRD